MSSNASSRRSKPAMGKGLSAILPGAPLDEATEHKVLEALSVNEIPLANIRTNPYQPRHDFDQQQLEELADSIRRHGIIQPITVRKLDDAQFELIAGERRLRASKMAGLEAIPAYVRSADAQDLLQLALIENVQRSDLNPMEVALAYKRLMDECQLTIEQVGTAVGKKRATVNNYLRLLKLPPEIQDALRREQLSMGHARALITVDDSVKQLALFRETLEKNLSVRQVEALVAKLHAKPDAQTADEEATSTPDTFTLQLRDMGRQLERNLGTRVEITRRGSQDKGEIRLAYHSLDHLNELLERLGHDDNNG